MTLEEISDSVKKCQKCKDLKPWKKFKDDTDGNRKSKTFIISEAPGKQSIDSEPQSKWVGTSGNRLRKILFETKNTRSLERYFYLTDIVKCQPPANRTPDKDEISNCFNYIWNEIRVLKPKYILVFGKIAFEFMRENFTTKEDISNITITEIHNNSGYSSIDFEEFTLIPLQHPSRANQNMDYDVYKKHVGEIFNRFSE